MATACSISLETGKKRAPNPTNFIQIPFTNFHIPTSSPPGELLLKENDMVLLSSQTDNLIGIAQGFIKSIRNNRREISLTIDKNLYQFFKSNAIITNSKKSINELIGKHLFRIDKVNYRSAISLNYTNMSRLMMPTEASRRLRSFIIEKQKPEFESVLPKQLIVKTKEYFKKLNKSQQAAVLKAIMAKDYLLIKGYPGRKRFYSPLKVKFFQCGLAKPVCVFSNAF